MKYIDLDGLVHEVTVIKHYKRVKNAIRYMNTIYTDMLERGYERLSDDQYDYIVSKIYKKYEKD